MAISLHEGDNRAALRRLIDGGVRVHAVVTDPPYGLESVAKRFGKQGSKGARTTGNDGSFARLSGGFMGKLWDATGIERDPEFWALVYEVLLPGGFVFAFSGSRTGHWQACAMELAGFIMHPMHLWAYGQGLPKGHDASKVIDKHLGTTHLREVVATRYEAKRFAPGATVLKEGEYRKRVDEDGNEQTFAATDERGGSPEARLWDGWKYGTQTRKPAAEPIYLGQKPYDGKPVESILKHGVGALNINGCRVPSEGGKAGRYPANLMHDGSPEVVALFPDSLGQLAAASTRTDIRKTQTVYGKMTHGSGGQPPRGDSGSASRFFGSFPLADEDIASIPPLFYCAKAGKADRAAHLVDRDAGETPHPTVKPITLLRDLVRHICPLGGTVLDPFAGTGTTGEAARLEGMNCILMEAEPDYVALLRRRFDLHPDYEAMARDMLT